MSQANINEEIFDNINAIRNRHNEAFTRIYTRDRAIPCFIKEIDDAGFLIISKEEYEEMRSAYVRVETHKIEARIRYHKNKEKAKATATIHEIGSEIQHTNPPKKGRPRKIINTPPAPIMGLNIINQDKLNILMK